MVAFRSRAFSSPEAFVEDFLASLRPGVIPRAEFIDWRSILERKEQFASGLELLRAVQERVRSGTDIRAALKNALDEAPGRSRNLVAVCFHVLGHTSPMFVSQTDDLLVSSVADDIVARKVGATTEFCILMSDLGLGAVLEAKDLDSLLLGVLIGLETHRRKNVGGESFKEVVRPVLVDAASAMTANLGRSVEVRAEETIHYGGGLSKKVDFALLLDGRVRVGVEVNFYTGPGSKPTEIKRSYGDLRRALASVGVDLVWVTDGGGYRKMARSLRDAYMIHPNIYNLRGLERNIVADLVGAVGTADR